MALKDISPILTLILGIMLGAAFTMLALGVQVDDGGLNLTFTTTTYTTEGGETTTVQRADLRQVALPYLVASPNAQAICVAGGGIWHESQDWVGCEGVGTHDCNKPKAMAARTQCIGVGADFVCSATNIHCTY